MTNIADIPLLLRKPCLAQSLLHAGDLHHTDVIAAVERQDNEFIEHFLATAQQLPLKKHPRGQGDSYLHACVAANNTTAIELLGKYYITRSSHPNLFKVIRWKKMQGVDRCGSALLYAVNAANKEMVVTLLKVGCSPLSEYGTASHHPPMPHLPQHLADIVKENPSRAEFALWLVSGLLAHPYPKWQTLATKAIAALSTLDTPWEIDCSAIAQNYINLRPHLGDGPLATQLAKTYLTHIRTKPKLGTENNKPAE